MSRAAPPLIQAVRALAATLVAAARTRFELFSLELAEQKELLFKLVLAGVVALLSLGMAALVFSGWVIAWFWDTEHRMLAIGLVGVFWLAVGVLTAWRAYLAVMDAPVPFELTRAELAKDAELLAARHAPVSGVQPPPEASTPFSSAQDQP